MSFTKKANDKLYGGTASATVEVFEKLPWDTKKVGDRRVVEVSTGCHNSSYVDAQNYLHGLVHSNLSSNEKLVSSISYNINSCD